MSGELCSICGEGLFGFGGQSSVAALGTAQAEAVICGMCRRAPPHFERAVAFGSYDGSLRELLHLLKYEGVRPVAGILGALLARSIAGAGLTEREFIVVAVPLHRSRRGQRGFNQAELLARAAARKLRGNWRIQADCLLRVRPTTSQTGLTRHQRRANLRGAFKVRNRTQVAGRDILLIDDVLTTGTTAAECARVLKRAGARQVYVATVARVLKGEDFRTAQTTVLANAASMMTQTAQAGGTGLRVEPL